MNSPASPTVYFTNPAGQLLIEPAGFVRAVWSGAPRRSSDTRAVFAHMQQAMKEHGWSRMLIDQRAMLPFSPEEQAWITQEWIPQAVYAGGYRHGAILVSANVMVRLATAFITTHVQGIPLIYRSFEAEAEAVEWLLQQPKAPQRPA